jgi:hypothetical protein
LKIFGCTSYVYNDNKQDKLDVRAIKTIFLGYSSQKMGYMCYDPIHKKFYISKNVTFQENEPYYKEKINEQNLLEPSLEISYSQTPEISQETPQIENKILYDQEVVLERNQEELEQSQDNVPLEESIEEIAPIRRSIHRLLEAKTNLHISLPRDWN